MLCLSKWSLFINKTHTHTHSKELIESSKQKQIAIYCGDRRRNQMTVIYSRKYYYYENMYSPYAAM